MADDDPRKSLQVLTIRDVSRALQLAEKTVYSMAASGDLPAFKVRGQWRIRRVDLESWLAAKAGAYVSLADLPDASDSWDKEEDADVPTGSTTRTQPVSALTERASTEEMHQRLVDALGPGRVRHHSNLASKPLELDLESPLPQRVRVYMYNATRPPGGRPLGEHKVQLIVPGQGRGERGSFDNGDGRIVLLIGYAAEEDVFILWDAGLYPDFAWSRNVQVKAETIIRASAGKLASQDRQLRPPGGRRVIETVLAARSHRLHDAIIRRMELTRERLLRE